MTKEFALKRIDKQVERMCPNESISTKTYIKEVIYMFFVSLENDADAEEHTSMQNLKYALEVNLCDLFNELLEEARRETK